MNGGSIIGLRAGRDDGDAAPHFDLHATEEPVWAQPVAEYEEEPRGKGWLVAALAGAAALVWILGVLWFARAELPALSATGWAGLVASLCVPPLLIGTLWLLAMRTSRAEAQRFGATARAMRGEAAALEASMAALSDRLAATRAELEDQGERLVRMGEQAEVRMRGVAQGLGAEAARIDTAADTIGRAGDDAERRLGALLAGLPRAQAETDAIAERLDTIGTAASERLAALDGALAALSARGRDADAIASGAAERLAAHMARMEATSESAGARLEAVTETMSAAIDIVLERAAAAIEEARRAITAQGDATIAMLQANSVSIERSGREAADALAERVIAIDGAITGLSNGIAARRDESEALLGLLGHGISDADARLDALHTSGVERAQNVAASVAALTEVAHAMTDAIDSGETTAERVIATAETLLTALDAAAREMDETLPGALERLDARIGTSRQLVSAAKPELLALVTAAESTHDAIEAIAGVVSMQRDTLGEVQQSLLDTLDRGRDRIGDVQLIVEQTVNAARRFTEEAAPQLRRALADIRDDADTTSEHARTTLAAVVPAAAAEMERQGSDALGRAIDRSVALQLAEMVQVANTAVAAAVGATERLSQQMLDITENAHSLDERLVAARAERDEANQEGMGRRVSLLIEAMNSAAIDVTRAFSADVSDSAWAAYLKGDRGVFTRRAVRLVDGTQARDIASLYDADATFRDGVNRYIHDFEAMLRQVLSTREGSPLGVTLLSSDMGKLYVVLAQAIERLRT